MDLGAATHPGYVRPDNEDGYFASLEQAVFAVADGMGGHEHGEVASHLALEAIIRHAEAIAAVQPTELPGQLHRAIQDANAAILSQADSQDARSRMGTTIVVASIHGDRLYFAHIGDSRLYLQRGELFTQLTRDHSLVQTMVDSGQITPEEAAIHPLRHQITRVVGGDDYISPEIASQALEPGDVLLLCTDGLCGVVPQETIRDILQQPTTCQQKADALVAAALQAGGPDNITVVLIAYERPRPTPEAQVHRTHLPLGQTLGILLLFMLACTLAFAGWSYTHPQYYIGLDAQENVGLYKRWVMLPMLQPVRLAYPQGFSVPLMEVRPVLDKQKYDIRQGISVEGEEAGAALLQQFIDDANNALLDDAKAAIEAKEFASARTLLARARSMKADPGLIDQLSTMIEE